MRHIRPALNHYLPFNADEAGFLDRMLAFLDRHENFYQRSNLEGHFTGSAWLLSPDLNRALLIHHKKLDRWLQPGGHADDDDETLWHTALREAKEECGLEIINPLSEKIFDLDIHRIPARGIEPEHWHLDVRYAFVVEGEWRMNAEEVNLLAWLPINELKLHPDASLSRLAEKTHWWKY